MYLTDTHVHLNMKDFRDDLNEVIERAHRQNVKQMVNIGYNIKSSEESLLLSEKYTFIYAAVGVHPHDAKKVEKNYLKILEDMSKSKKVIAIGEIGLDYYRDLSPRDVQKRVFEEQLELAISLELPVIIHEREARKDTLKIIKKYRNKLKGGLFHAFSGGEEFLDDYLDIDFYYGIGGVITFKNAYRLRNMVKKLPIDRLLIETDCPYLTPHPFRGRRNEPGFVTLVRDHLSLILGVSKEEMNQILYKNTKRALDI